MLDFNKNLQYLRKTMQESGYDFYFITSSDCHNNEFVLDTHKYIEWLSGFNGSSGTLLVGLDSIVLWTDSRYLLQAESQLIDTCVLKESKNFSQDIKKIFDHNYLNNIFVIDPQLITIEHSTRLETLIVACGLQYILDTSHLLFNMKQEFYVKNVLHDNRVHLHPIQYSGKSTKDKLFMIRKMMKTLLVDTFVINVLDEIAWLFNIRGNEVPFSPLVVSYAVVKSSTCELYVDTDQLDMHLHSYLLENSILLFEYGSFFNRLSLLTGNIWLDSNTMNLAVLQCITNNTDQYFARSPIILAKAIKNNVELEGSKTAHIKDAVAVISFMYWLESAWKDGVNEIQAQKKLLEFRKLQDNFQLPSFNTISAFGSNAAIVHYNAIDTTVKIINDTNLYLLDSGGHYYEGTTDVTRVMHLGNPTMHHKKYYTCVLKGHLAIKNIIFPKGTCGEHIDVLARLPLWQQKLNYGHGTGHGVGSFLCVHEGPQSISPCFTGQPLLPGMIVSNEPGVYFQNLFGIRIENLCFVTPTSSNTHNNESFYHFEDLTFIPYAKKLIDVSSLNISEINQINAYHKTVRDRVLNKIQDVDVHQWLLEQTTPL